MTSTLVAGPTTSTSPASSSSPAPGHWEAAPTWELADGRRALVRFTGRAEGDLTQIGPARSLAHRRRRVTAGNDRWTWLRQVHGSTVVRVTEPGEHAATQADAAVTTVSGAPLAVRTADCAGVALVSPDGVIGVAHAGWRGVVAGVLDATVEAMRDLGARQIDAALGPLIHPECYEFGEEDLAALVERLGDEVATTTPSGTPALDLPTAVGAALERLDVALRGGPGPCTGHDERWFSHRSRRDPQRQATVAWIEDR